MLEKITEKTKEQRGEMLNEDKYYEECTEYALSTGWVKKKEKDTLKEKYLKPIFQKYLNIIQETRNEIRSEDDPGTSIENIIEKLNVIMERTKRIGSTEPTNITRSINDYYRFACTQDTYTEYAAMSLYQFIADTIK